MNTHSDQKHPYGIDPRWSQKKRLTRYVVRKDRYALLLNDEVIDEGTGLSLGEKVFDTFSGQTLAGIQTTHFAGGDMNREEWEEFQCKRLNLESLSGDLRLVSTFTDETLRSCTIL